MNMLYININGDDIKSTENMAVVGKPEDAIISKFYFELVKEIVKGVAVPGIGEVKKKSLVTDFEANNAKAFAKITEQLDLVKQALLGDNPDVTFKMTLPQEYVEWLYNHSDSRYNKVAESLASRGNAVEVNIGNIYKNGLLLLVNNIDTKKEYGQFVVSDTLVDDDSAIAVAIRKRIGEDVPFVPFVDFEIPKNGSDTNAPTMVVVEQPADGGDLTIKAKDVSFVMKPVEGGTFQMGNDDSDAFDAEKPVHSVTVSTFYMGETEVTQALWKAVMGNNPSSWKGDNLPVENVSWNDCQMFIKELNRMTGRSFRLPTEAEWEYAARGGRKSNGCTYAGGFSIDKVAWYDANSGFKTHEVKGKSPNELGLYDMSGNVYEWCSDWKGSYGSGSQTNPKGPSSGSNRVLRGGSWFSDARYCRVSLRNDYDPDDRSINHGFRLCLPEKSAYDKAQSALKEAVEDFKQAMQNAIRTELIMYRQ